MKKIYQKKKKKKKRIKAKHLLSDPLTIMRVRHGYLLSMLLYIIATKVLANFINTGKVITGIEKGDHEFEIINLLTIPPSS